MDKERNYSNHINLWGWAYMAANETGSLIYIDDVTAQSRNVLLTRIQPNASNPTTVYEKMFKKIYRNKAKISLTPSCGRLLYNLFFFFNSAQVSIKIIKTIRGDRPVLNILLDKYRNYKF